MPASTGQRQVQVSKSVLNVHQARTRPVEILCVNYVLLDRTRTSMVLRSVTCVPRVNTRAVKALPSALIRVTWANKASATGRLRAT